VDVAEDRKGCETQDDGKDEDREWRLYQQRRRTNLADFPIRQPQVRIPLPTEEEPPKARMDPGLQEVRYMDQGRRIIADLCLFSRYRHLITLLLSTRTRTRLAWIEPIGCTRRVSLRRSPRRGAGRTSRFRWVILLEE
jgi:hypothetical protein